jgi:rRNA maturation protein Nop10
MLSIFPTCVRTKANIQRWEMYVVGAGRRGCWSKCRLKLEQQSAGTGAACGLLCGENWTNRVVHSTVLVLSALGSQCFVSSTAALPRRFSYCCSAGSCYTTSLQVIVTLLPFRWLLHYCHSGGPHAVALQVVILLAFRWLLYYCPSGGFYTIALQVIVTLLPFRRFSYCCYSGGCYTTALQVVVILLPFRWLLHYCPSGGCYTIAFKVIVITLPFRWLLYFCPSSGFYTIALQVVVILFPLSWLFYYSASGGYFTTAI